MKRPNFATVAEVAWYEKTPKRVMYAMLAKIAADALLGDERFAASSDYALDWLQDQERETRALELDIS
jgi:hypothetical protein